MPRCPSPDRTLSSRRIARQIARPIAEAPRRSLRARCSISLPVIALLTGCLLGTASQADTRQHRDDRHRGYGRVIDVRPVYAEVPIRNAVRHCDGRGHDRHERPSRHDRPHRAERPFGHDRGYRRDYDDERGHRSGNAGVILGGVIGGTVGNRIARHRSRDSRVASTVAGALIGSAIGHGVSRSHRYDRRPHRRPAQRCYDSVTTRYETRLQHYDVTYVYRGRTFHTTRSQDPGERIVFDIRQRPSRR